MQKIAVEAHGTKYCEVRLRTAPRSIGRSHLLWREHGFRDFRGLAAWGGERWRKVQNVSKPLLCALQVSHRFRQCKCISDVKRYIEIGGGPLGMKND